jgi:hypothetical protein
MERKKSYKPLFRSHRQTRRAKLRKMYGDPWDNTTSSSSKQSNSMPRKSAMKSSSKRRTKKNVSFKEPLDKSRSSTSSAHAAWRSVSSK